MNSYQKLKEQNRALQERLATVCLYPESEEAKIIIKVVKMGKQLEDSIWQGNPYASYSAPSVFDIARLIEKQVNG